MLCLPTLLSLTLAYFYQTFRMVDFVSFELRQVRDPRFQLNIIASTRNNVEKGITGWSKCVLERGLDSSISQNQSYKAE